MRLFLFVLTVSIVTACSGKTDDVFPCIEDYCLTGSILEFTQSMTLKNSDFETDEFPSGDKIRLMESVAINGAEFDLEFSETRIPQQEISTSMVLSRKMKSVSEQMCEAAYISTLDYISLKLGPFHAINNSTPNDYVVQQKRTKAAQHYRRIESPRGQITFQAELADSSASFELKILGPVFTAHRGAPDCNIVIWFQSN